MNDDLKSPEPSTTVANKPPVVQPVEQKPVFEKKKYNKAFSFVGILLLLTILGTGVLAYLWYDQSQQIVTLKNEVISLKAAPTATDLPLVGKGFVPQSAINAVATNYVEAYRSVQSAPQAPYVVKIKYMTDTFARVDVALFDPADKTKQTGTEATLFLKKVAGKDGGDGSWVLIWTQDVQAADKDYLKNKFGVTDDIFTTIREE